MNTHGMFGAFRSPSCGTHGVYSCRRANSEVSGSFNDYYVTASFVCLLSTYGTDPYGYGSFNVGAS